MTIFFIVVFLIYYVLVLALAFGWAILGERQQKESTNDRFLSVVIAFRNEEMNLPVLLIDLQKQNYPTEKFEVILIDDHSDDQSVEVIQRSNVSFIKPLQLSPELTGKKAALDFGIRHAKGEIIVTTDADCHVLPDWLSTVNSQFQDEKVKMVTGLVRIDESHSLFSKLQAMEFISLIGTTGGSLGLGAPTMCNGANLAFRKSAYQDVNGYEGNKHIPSGDDEFLMRKIALKWKNSIHFMDDDKAIVFTSAQNSFLLWVNQRLRWAGKWRYNSSVFTKAVALTVIGFHLSFLTFIALAITGQLTLKLFTLLWGTKMMVETFFLIPVSASLRLRWRWISFLILQFTYSLYVVVIGILSQVRGYEWKGRRSGPNVP